MLTVNCAAIPRNCSKANCLDTKRGPSPARQPITKGLVYKPDQGTLFLDEIGRDEPRRPTKVATDSRGDRVSWPVRERSKEVRVRRSSGSRDQPPILTEFVRDGMVPVRICFIDSACFEHAGCRRCEIEAKTSLSFSGPVLRPFLLFQATADRNFALFPVGTRTVTQLPMAGATLRQLRNVIDSARGDGRRTRKSSERISTSAMPDCPTIDTLRTGRLGTTFDRESIDSDQRRCFPKRPNCSAFSRGDRLPGKSPIRYRSTWMAGLLAILSAPRSSRWRPSHPMSAIGRELVQLGYDCHVSDSRALR